jgi:hypothetical protein
MGFRSWFRRFVSKVKEVLGIHDKWNDFVAEAFFEDGGRSRYTGKPWGAEFDMFKNMAQVNAWKVTMNMTGDFCSFS